MPDDNDLMKRKIFRKCFSYNQITKTIIIYLKIPDYTTDLSDFFTFLQRFLFFHFPSVFLFLLPVIVFFLHPFSIF